MARSPEAVWPVLLDLERAPAYVPFLDELRPLDGPPRVGARVRARFRRGGRVHDVEGRVTAFEPERLLVVEAPIPALDGRAALRYELVPEAGGTRLVLELELRFAHVLAELAARALSPGLERRQHETVDRLVAEIEGDGHVA